MASVLLRRTVEPVRLDVLLHRSWRAKAETLAGGDPLAELGARQLDERHLDLGLANLCKALRGDERRQDAEIGLGGAAATNHGWNGQLADSRGLAPGWQVAQRIGAHQQKQH